MTQYKTCTKCGQTKLLAFFHKDKSRRDGLFPQCKLCVLERMRHYTSQNGAANRLKASSWYQRNQKKAYSASLSRRKANPKKHLTYQKQYRISNKEKLQDYYKNYYQNNGYKYRNYGAKRRERKATNFTVTKKEILALLQSACHYCGAPSEHIDHIVPLSRGGRHSIGNLTGACKSCNLSKGAKFITEWKRDKL